MSSRTVLGVGGLLLAAGAVAVWLAVRDADPPSAAGAPPPPSTRSPAQVDPIAPVAEGSSAAATIAPDRLLYLPDGTAVPALNGVTGMRKQSWWPGKRPWSPIKGKIVAGDGVEWYEHEDGSRTTTKMFWRSDLGREDASVLFVYPTDPLPILGEDTAAPRSGR